MTSFLLVRFWRLGYRPRIVEHLGDRTCTEGARNTTRYERGVSAAPTRASYSTRHLAHEEFVNLAGRCSLRSLLTCKGLPQLPKLLQPRRRSRYSRIVEFWRATSVHTGEGLRGPQRVSHLASDLQRRRARLSERSSVNRGRLRGPQRVSHLASDCPSCRHSRPIHVADWLVHASDPTAPPLPAWRTGSLRSAEMVVRFARVSQGVHRSCRCESPPRPSGELSLGHRWQRQPDRPQRRRDPSTTGAQLRDPAAVHTSAPPGIESKRLVERSSRRRGKEVPSSEGITARPTRDVSLNR